MSEHGPAHANSQTPPPPLSPCGLESPFFQYSLKLFLPPPSPLGAGRGGSRDRRGLPPPAPLTPPAWEQLPLSAAVAVHHWAESTPGVHLLQTLVHSE